jgi:hypothetical protein
MKRAGARRRPDDQLTVRGVDARLAAEIRRIARIEGISLNRAALRLLAKGAGFVEPKAEPPVIGTSLDHLFGTWSQSQADDMLESIRSCEQIDRDFWR